MSIGTMQSDKNMLFVKNVKSIKLNGKELEYHKLDISSDKQIVMSVETGYPEYEKMVYKRQKGYAIYLNNKWTYLDIK